MKASDWISVKDRLPRTPDYACLNNLGRFDIYDDKEYKAKVVEHIKTLPDDTIFFFQDSHF